MQPCQGNCSNRVKKSSPVRHAKPSESKRSEWKPKPCEWKPKPCPCESESKPCEWKPKPCNRHSEPEPQPCRSRHHHCPCPPKPKCKSEYAPTTPVHNADNSMLLQEVISGNEQYAEDYTPQPNIVPLDNAAIVTCMDARLDPLQFTGIVDTGKVHVIRNAGGRVNEDTIRSLIISEKLLATNQWFVIHHTDCGMQKFDQGVMDNLLEESLVTATLTKNCNQTLVPTQPVCTCQWENETFCGSWTNDEIDWQAITKGLEFSVYEDVKKIRKHPGVPPYSPIYGFIFDVLTGKLIPVPKATKAGRARPLCCDKK